MGAEVTPATVTQCASMQDHLLPLGRLSIESVYQHLTEWPSSHIPGTKQTTQPRVEEAGSIGKPLAVPPGQPAIRALQGTAHAGK